MLNRRMFLKMMAFATLGMSLETLTNVSAKSRSPFEATEPMIYKRLLDFTEYEKRADTDFIVIHHTGFPEVDKDSTVVDIHKLHQEVNGWAGVGYHYLIRKDGMIEQGRRPDMIGAHALHYNKTSIGICLAGNFDIGIPTKAQLDSVKELTSWLCSKYNIDTHKKGFILGHRDLNDTACPGDNLYRELDEIRNYCKYNGTW